MSSLYNTFETKRKKQYDKKIVSSIPSLANVNVSVSPRYDNRSQS